MLIWKIDPHLDRPERKILQLLRYTSLVLLGLSIVTLGLGLVLFLPVAAAWAIWSGYCRFGVWVDLNHEKDRQERIERNRQAQQHWPGQQSGRPW